MNSLISVHRSTPQGYWSNKDKAFLNVSNWIQWKKVLVWEYYHIEGFISTTFGAYLMWLHSFAHLINMRSGEMSFFVGLKDTKSKIVIMWTLKVEWLTAVYSTPTSEQTPFKFVGEFIIWSWGKYILLLWFLCCHFCLQYFLCLIWKDISKISLQPWQTVRGDTGRFSYT